MISVERQMSFLPQSLMGNWRTSWDARSQRLGRRAERPESPPSAIRQRIGKTGSAGWRWLKRSISLGSPNALPSDGSRKWVDGGFFAPNALTIFPNLAVGTGEMTWILFKGCHLNLDKYGSNDLLRDDYLAIIVVFRTVV
jgi:hypothetical protein